MSTRISSRLQRMAGEFPKTTQTEAASESSSRRSQPSILRWPPALRWIPSSVREIMDSERRLLTLVKTRYVQEQVNIGTGPKGSKVSWFRSPKSEPRFINTVTFECTDNGSAPTLVLLHGYAASHGFFFRNFDALATRFRVIALDQLGWGASSRPEFVCKSTEEAESWFIESLEEWRKAKNLDKFILLGHSLGGYIAAKYALKHPEHVQHLILVGPAGFSEESDKKAEWLVKFRSTWKGALLSHLWESNFTPQKIIRSSEWKVPTTFIYGYQDWMDYEGAQEARKFMPVPVEIIRVPNGGHFVFMDNASAFHTAVFYACRNFLDTNHEPETLGEGLIKV